MGVMCLECGAQFGSWRALERHQFDSVLCRWTPGAMMDGNRLLRLSFEGVPVDPEIIARICHEAARALQIEAGDPVVNPSWDDAPEWLRASVLDGVSLALDGASPQDLHEHWCAYRWADGWTYGPVKDLDTRTHPLLVPYERLEAEQRARAEVFVAIVASLR